MSAHPLLGRWMVVLMRVAGVISLPNLRPRRTRVRSWITPFVMSGQAEHAAIYRRYSLSFWTEQTGLLMRSATYSMGVSLDGYIVGPDGGFDWTAPDNARVGRDLEAYDSFTGVAGHAPLDPLHHF